MALQPPAIRDERVVVKFDKEFIERVNDLANRRFEGNRSWLVRVAVRELVDRANAADHDGQTASAA